MKKRKKSSAVGCLFWLFLAVLLAIAAFAARKPLEAALQKLTGGKYQSPPKVVIKPLSDGEKRRSVEPEGPSEKPPAPGSGGAPADRPLSVETNAPAQSSQEKPVFRKTRLFFANVDPNGKIILKGVIRAIPASDSPLHDTIQTLLTGPNSYEQNLGLLSMIPSGSRLRGVTMRGDTAFIDFSESFRFNTLGREGLNAQLQQVVFASTEFPTVKKVQILIEGKKVQYLGPEGIRIDAPLTRASFRE
jgi:germination protein M